MKKDQAPAGAVGVVVLWCCAVVVLRRRGVVLQSWGGGADKGPGQALNGRDGYPYSVARHGHEHEHASLF